MISRKLRSKAGSSLMLALLLMFVCITLSGLILSAATANVGSTREVRQERQAYLTVSSAAKLMKKLMEESEYEVVVTTEIVSYTYKDAEGNELEGTYTKKDLAWEKSGPFGWMLEALSDKHIADNLNEKENAFVSPARLQISVNDSGAEALQDVSVTITGNSDSNRLSCVLHLAENPSADCRLAFDTNLKVEGPVPGVTDGNYTETTTYTFDTDRSYIAEAN